MIYLATPYTHPDVEVRKNRYREAVAVAYRLTVNGHNIFSPIIATHEMGNQFNLPYDYAFWENWCHDFISSSKVFLACCMDGWEDSAGVGKESTYARSINVPVRFLWKDDLYMPDEDLAKFAFHEFPQSGDKWTL